VVVQTEDVKHVVYNRYTNAALHVTEKCYKSMKKNEQNRTHYCTLLTFFTNTDVYVNSYVHSSVLPPCVCLR